MNPTYRLATKAFSCQWTSSPLPAPRSFRAKATTDASMTASSVQMIASSSSPTARSRNRNRKPYPNRGGDSGHDRVPTNENRANARGVAERAPPPLSRRRSRRATTPRSTNRRREGAPVQWSGVHRRPAGCGRCLLDRTLSPGRRARARRSRACVFGDLETATSRLGRSRGQNEEEACRSGNGVLRELTSVSRVASECSSRSRAASSAEMRPCSCHRSIAASTSTLLTLAPVRTPETRSRRRPRGGANLRTAGS